MPFFLLLFTAIIYAQAPSSYYKSAEGKSQAELKTALHKIIRSHTFLNYDGGTNIWWYTYFKASDWHPNGYFWDMYSNDKYSTYSGSRQNREHCMPRSWWNAPSTDGYGDANGDLNNLYPSNNEANEAKLNYPLGETSTYFNGVIKVGKSILSGYSDVVFEPADEYKGDFARTYMYMVTCYEDYSNRWTSIGTQSMLNKNRYPTLNKYAVELLLKWHRNDPVSKKETDRNNAVYKLQGNRNPFIDHPDLAEFIWGNKTNEVWKEGMIYQNFNISINNEGTELTIHASARENDELTYQMYSIEGVLVQHQKINAYDNSISIATLNDGMYILVVYLNNERHTVKFYKQSRQ